MSSENSIWAMNDFEYDDKIFEQEFKSRNQEMYDYIMEELVHFDLDGLKGINHLDSEDILGSLSMAIGETTAILAYEVEGNPPTIWIVKQGSYTEINFETIDLVALAKIISN